MTASLSPVYPSGFSTRGAPKADAELVERMRDPHFRIGCLEFELEMAANELRRAAEHVKGDFRRRAIVDRCEAIERTLRLCRAALEPAAQASECVPVAATGIAA